MPNRIASFDQWLADWRRLVKHFIYLQCLGICSQTALYLQTPPGHTCAAPISWCTKFTNLKVNSVWVLSHPIQFVLWLTAGGFPCEIGQVRFKNTDLDWYSEEMHDVSMTPFYTFMVLILPFWSYGILPQCIKARAWASGSGFWNLKPSPSPLQALVRARLGLGLNGLGSAGSGLEARPSTSLAVSKGKIFAVHDSSWLCMKTHEVCCAMKGDLWARCDIGNELIFISWLQVY